MHANFFTHFDLLLLFATHGNFVFKSSLTFQMHRNERFSTDFQQRIENLSQVLIPYIVNKYKEMPVETQELNRSLAHFLKVEA